MAAFSKWKSTCGGWSGVTSSGALRVAIVIPWYGRDANGGAERQARQVADALAGRGLQVEVLTTCARSFLSRWSVNYYPAGGTFEGRVKIVRFPVDQRDAEAFERANSLLTHVLPSSLRPGVSPVDDETERAFIRNGINSRRLVAYLKASYEMYDVFMFLPYPYGLIVDGVDAVARKAVLQPCLHDEAYAYLPTIEATMHAARELLFNSEAERELALRLYGPGIAEKSGLSGEWIDDRPIAPARRIGNVRPARERYVLYLGKRDRTKQFDVLVEAFRAFRRDEPMSTLKLFAAGPGNVSYASSKHGVVDFGYVSEAAKRSLIEHARAVLQPSLNESFSRVVMEAWASRKPVGVNARCSVTARLVADSGGGWCAATKAEWSRLFGNIDAASREELTDAGGRGYAYYLERASRERIVDRYVECFRRVAPVRAGKTVAIVGHTKVADAWEDDARRAELVRRRLSQTGIDIASAPDALDAAVVDVRTLPDYTPADSSLWDVTPHPGIARKLADGKLNVLYVGRLDEQACLEQLVAGLAFLLALGDDARLILVGRFDERRQVAERLYAQIGDSGLGERVLLFENVPVPVLAACYRNAHLFWSMADGWPVVAPILDAMMFSLPVVAYASAMARVVLGGGGVLFNAKEPLYDAAGLVHVVAADRELQRTVLAAQHERLHAYSASRWLAALDVAVS
jgi:glycosyltransferase involved in cell wall biosynthesis